MSVDTVVLAVAAATQLSELDRVGICDVPVACVAVEKETWRRTHVVSKANMRVESPECYTSATADVMSRSRDSPRANR